MCEKAHRLRRDNLRESSIVSATKGRERYPLWRRREIVGALRPLPVPPHPVPPPPLPAFFAHWPFPPSPSLFVAYFAALCHTVHPRVHLSRDLANHRASIEPRTRCFRRSTAKSGNQRELWLITFSPLIVAATSWSPFFYFFFSFLSVLFSFFSFPSRFCFIVWSRWSTRSVPSIVSYLSVNLELPFELPSARLTRHGGI